MSKFISRHCQKLNIDFKNLNNSALCKAESVVASLLPNGKRIGNEWTALNPRRNDQSFGSFKINLNTGKWADFATGDHGGDIISLIAFIEGCSQYEAAKSLARTLGVFHG